MDKKIKLNIKPGENVDINVLSSAGNFKDIDPETVNYESVCPNCGTKNDKQDIFKKLGEKEYAYKCRKCAEKYAKNFGIYLS